MLHWRHSHIRVTWRTDLLGPTRNFHKTLYHCALWTLFTVPTIPVGPGPSMWGTSRWFWHWNTHIPCRVEAKGPPECPPSVGWRACCSWRIVSYELWESRTRESGAANICSSPPTARCLGAHSLPTVQLVSSIFTGCLWLQIVEVETSSGLYCYVGRDNLWLVLLRPQAEKATLLTSAGLGGPSWWMAKTDWALILWLPCQ